jgi:hypothetical protein
MATTGSSYETGCTELVSAKDRVWKRTFCEIDGKMKDYVSLLSKRF